jgi:ribonuclease-3 family protein
MENLFQMELTEAQVNEIPNLSLALVGDGVYELMCRTHLCAGGDRKLLNLHRDTVEMVKAPAQAKFADKLLPYLTDAEQAYYRRGKNAHTHAAPKAATRQEYQKATGLECLFGALYLLGKTDRLNELFAIIIND